MLIHQVGDKPVINEPAPYWVNSKNISARIWNAMLQLKAEKLECINAHRARADTFRKRDFSIRKRDISDIAECHPSSLYNRTFSAGFEESLDDLNAKLAHAKSCRLKHLRKVGRKGRRKEELLEEVRQLSAALDRQKNVNTTLMVDEIFERLPLKTRRALQLV